MQITLPTADVLCLYGLPDHELYTDLIQWLAEDEERFVVILEDDERALLGKQTGHERIRLCYGVNEEALKKIAWELVFLHFEYWRTPGNSSKDPAKMQQLFDKMVFYQEGIQLVASDFQNRGVDLLYNYLKNSFLFPKAKHIKDLFGAFHGTPAIICGAGPSLEKEISCLRNLKDQALIFAGGTAISSLSHFDICPHFGALIDPHPPSQRYFQHQAHHIPLFFQARAHPSLLKQMQGPLLYVPGNLHDLFDEELFEGGWNVSTVLTAIAYHLGCNPIILVGVDLAQTREKSYAGDLNRPEEGELIRIEKGLFSRRDWLIAGKWLEEFAAGHPEIQWINTSSGLEIQGFKKKLLQELSFKHPIDSAAILQTIQNMQSGILNEYQADRVYQSFEKVGVLCEKILDLLEKLFPTPPEKSGEYALLELDVEKEVAYERFLSPIWEVWKHVFKRKLPLDVPRAYGIDLNKWLFMKGICDDARKI